jgi:mannose-6-phosphate isomerase
MLVQHLYPLQLKSSLHETIWGGRRLEREGLKLLPLGNIRIGESWETEISTVVQNGAYAGKMLAEIVDELGPLLLGEHAIALCGKRFPLLAKFTDIDTQVSVHVHPHDIYAAQYENKQLGKTEFWYILAAEPGATFVHGFKSTTLYQEVQNAISERRLDSLLLESPIYAGDVVLVPAGTVHALRGGVMLYELQEYSDLTYRMYDYGRLKADGTPRDLHIEHALNVLYYDKSSQIKVMPVTLIDEPGYEDQCLVACQHFLTRRLHFKQLHDGLGAMTGKTEGSCIILSSLGAEVRIQYGGLIEHSEMLSKGQTIVLPASLGYFRIEGHGILLYSYVPTPGDIAWKKWDEYNRK